MSIDAREEGRRARDRMLELDDCPYTNDPEDDDREYNPDEYRAWRMGWNERLQEQLDEALGRRRGNDIARAPRRSRRHMDPDYRDAKRSRRQRCLAMSQASLFDSPVASAPSARADLALGDRVTWMAGTTWRTGRLVYVGPAMAFYGHSEHWLSRWEWETFMRQPKRRRGDWMLEEATGELRLTRDQSGWYAHRRAEALERVA
jgi:hypothetical protein